jgi:hypothetical protein
MGEKMNRLSTGLVIAGAYADKVRRTLFAQTRQYNVPSNEVVRASAELNRVLFEILVNKLKIEKGDVVRIRIDYDIVDGKIKWYYNTLQIEAFKRIPDEEISSVVKNITGGLEESESPKEIASVSNILSLGKNAEGRSVYMLKDDRGETVGIVSVEEKGEESIVRGVIIEPKPVSFSMNYKGEVKGAPDVVSIIRQAEKKEISKEEAKNIIKDELKGIL